MTPLHRSLFCAVAALALTQSARADEGMWTFDAFPRAAMQKAYGFAPDQKWLDTTRQAAIRLTNGCSASIVSSEGLVLTNHHCVVSCVQALSTGQSDLVKDGFLADRRTAEQKCPGQQAEIVTAISDVTPRVQAAIGTATGAVLAKARDAAIAAIESENCGDAATNRCQVITLFGGGQYKLYRYRKYSDVRLAFAPEYQAAFFGGDPDNFNFPRYALDAAFLRVYENGQPAKTPAHLKWNPTPPKDGDVTFVVGNPGSTQRLFTGAQFAMRRDTIFPLVVPYQSELRGRLISAMADDPEKTRTGGETLSQLENSYKVAIGQWQALRDPAFSKRLADAETALRGKVAADAGMAAKIGDPWADVSASTDAYTAFYPDYYLLEANAGASSELYSYAKRLVRAAQERAKPDADRLPGYSASRLPLLEKQLTDVKPVYPWLEELKLGFWLSKTREYLTADNAQVKALLGKDSPEALAKRLVEGSTLGDPAVRKALYDGGLAAVQASSDPLIRFVLANDSAARALEERYRAQVDGPVTAAQARLAQARFAAYGDSVYPDATFSLRISYGAVKGWQERGTTISPFTTMSGLWDRATGSPPFDAATKMLAAKDRLDPATLFNFTTTNDIIGGNSGSPVIARDGSVIGAAFDGNIHSIGGAYGYDPLLNRTIVVSAAAVQEVLAKAYGGDALIKELNRR